MKRPIFEVHDDWWNLDELEKDLAKILDTSNSENKIEIMGTKQMLVKKIDDRL